MPKTTGAILMASGRVPKTDSIFIGVGLCFLENSCRCLSPHDDKVTLKLLGARSIEPNRFETLYCLLLMSPLYKN